MKCIHYFEFQIIQIILFLFCSVKIACCKFSTSPRKPCTHLYRIRHPRSRRLQRFSSSGFIVGNDTNQQGYRYVSGRLRSFLSRSQQYSSMGNADPSAVRNFGIIPLLMRSVCKPSANLSNGHNQISFLPNSTKTN